ncbi:hypothetical protein Tco_0289660 [Tanacetum coccineum]
MVDIARRRSFNLSICFIKRLIKSLLKSRCSFRRFVVWKEEKFVKNLETMISCLYQIEGVVLFLGQIVLHLRGKMGKAKALPTYSGRSGTLSIESDLVDNIGCGMWFFFVMSEETACFENEVD